MKRWICAPLLLLILLMLFSACGKLSRKGTAPSNVAPEVFMVNIPPDSANFSTLAKIYWYGFDQDGYISRYQYLVIPDTGGLVPKSGGYIDPAFVQLIEEVSPEDWNDSSLSVILGINKSALSVVDSVENNVGTWDNVMLFASLDTTIYVAQYFFVRGVDNDGAISKIWKPDSEKGSNFRWFTRSNRPPITKVKYSSVETTDPNYLLDDSILTEYCLPETTVDWRGLKFSWEAEDPDYSSRSQPSFNFSWSLLGPFADPSSIDTTQVYYSSWNSTTSSPILDSTSRLIVDLENAPGELYGWYQFRVCAWDDAFAPDPTPAAINFKITKPPFLFQPEDYGRRVLLVDATSYDGKLIVPYRDSIRNFYMGMLQELKDSLDIISDYSLFRWETNPNYVFPVPEDTLSRYGLAIFFNEGRFSAIQGYGADISSAIGNDTGFVQIERYLRVGGKVWMIGQNNFGVDEQPVPSYIPIDPNGSGKYGYKGPAVTVANYFCGVTGFNYPAFSSDTVNLVNGRNEEMIKAEPFDPYGVQAGLPTLEVDPVKLSKRYWDFYVFKFTPPWDSLKGIPRASWESIWNNYYNERLYTFISYKGSQSTLHGRACASRAYSPDPWTFYDEPGQPTLQWKTAEFCFPCLPIKRDNMLELMEVMVNWFLSDQVYP